MNDRRLSALERRNLRAAIDRAVRGRIRIRKAWNDRGNGRADAGGWIPQVHVSSRRLEILP